MEPTSAPELPAGLDWLNVPATSLRDQRGRVVAMVFVNAASAWSVQRLHELATLQQRLGGRLVVWAVHVPRFDSERDGAAVLKRLRRQGIACPIIQDRGWRAWQHYQVQAWPTVLLIDSQGRVRERLVGVDEDLERALAPLCAQAATPADMPALRESSPEPRLPLLFPTALAATEDRLYVADSGHHRILECTHGGRVLRQFGQGTAGLIDGGADHAAFRCPHGLALMRESLYVADTGNHAVRRIHLPSGHVDTLVGNGRPGMPVEGAVHDARAVALSRPQGIVATNRELYLALAGDNRIWSYDLGQPQLRCLAGSGQLDVRDGSGALAAFAQPVALALVQQALYVADELGSAVRCLQLRNDVVQTLVGQNAWSFGQQDGRREQALLQAPEAIALDPGAPLLWIADTGNGRLRTLRLGGGMVATVALPRALKSPAGLSVAAGKVFIAETDAHAVLCYTPSTGELGHVAVDE